MIEELNPIITMAVELVRLQDANKALTEENAALKEELARLNLAYITLKADKNWWN